MNDKTLLGKDVKACVERLDAAKRMMEVEHKVPEGAKIVRALAEEDDLAEAWRYMLECHENGVGPFKTNKFRRAAKSALARIEKGVPPARPSALPKGCRLFSDGDSTYVTSLPLGAAREVLSAYKRSKGGL